MDPYLDDPEPQPHGCIYWIVMAALAAVYLYGLLILGLIVVVVLQAAFRVVTG